MLVGWLESAFLLLLTTGPLHRLCYLRRRRRRFAFLKRSGVNVTNLAYSLQLTAFFFNANTKALPPTSVSEGPKQFERKSVLFSIGTPLTNRRKKGRLRNASSESADTHCYSDMHKVTCYYFCSLCFAVIILNSFAILTTVGAPQVQTLGGFNSSSPRCILLESSVLILNMLMVCSLVQLTADRFIAVCMPLKYWHLVTKKRCITAIAIGWIIALLFILVSRTLYSFYSTRVSLHPVSSQSSSQSFAFPHDLLDCFILATRDDYRQRPFLFIYLLGAYIIPLCFVVFAYIRIYLLVKRAANGCSVNGSCILNLRRRISGPDTGSIVHAITRRSNASAPPPLPVENHTLRPPTSAIERHFSQESRLENSGQVRGSFSETRAAKTAFCVVLTFFGLTLPYMCVIFYEALQGDAGGCVESIMRHAPTTFIFQQNIKDLICHLSVILLYSNTILTPVVYICRDGMLRKRFRSFNRSLRQRQQIRKGT
ncbi:unnamed protein product [Schistocephalus solidus]|uniref:G_PROTEIN_RECEP_F1_2 domain-containing protein n=1 Tax=Schistocephalus solidus TaxID=70667 RepID=A0A183S8Z2_SCHSO|nr:unnamed protein product [Schistocephalus solidus]